MSEPGADREVTLRPVPTDDRRAILTGSLMWLVGLLGCLLWHDRLVATGRGWWLWVCVAGLVLGTLGVIYLHTHGRWNRRRNDGESQTDHRSQAG